MTPAERRIINGLLAGDNEITTQFFFTKCRPLINGIIHNIYRDNADYDELANNGRRLRSFSGGEEQDSDRNNTYALLMWLKTTALRFFANKAEREQSIEQRRKYVINEDGEETDVEVEDKNCRDPQIDMDAHALLDMVELERDRDVLTKYFLEELDFDDLAEDMGISKENIYNIKTRAINRLKQLARHATSNESLCSIICEQYVLDVFGIHKSLIDLRALSEENGWLKDTGVTLEDIGAICRHLGLDVTSTSGSSLEDVASSLDAGRQVIAAVDGGEGSVTLYDPAYGYMPLTVSNEHFIDAWTDSGRYCVSIK